MIKTTQLLSEDTSNISQLEENTLLENNPFQHINDVKKDDAYFTYSNLNEKSDSIVPQQFSFFNYSASSLREDEFEIPNHDLQTMPRYVIQQEIQFPLAFRSPSPRAKFHSTQLYSQDLQYFETENQIDMKQPEYQCYQQFTLKQIQQNSKECQQNKKQGQQIFNHQSNSIKDYQQNNFLDLDHPLISPFMTTKSRKLVDNCYNSPFARKWQSPLHFGNCITSSDFESTFQSPDLSKQPINQSPLIIPYTNKVIESHPQIKGKRLFVEIENDYERSRSQNKNQQKIPKDNTNFHTYTTSDKINDSLEKYLSDHIYSEQFMSETKQAYEFTFADQSYSPHIQQKGCYQQYQRSSEKTNAKSNKRLNKIKTKLLQQSDKKLIVKQIFPPISDLLDTSINFTFNHEKKNESINKLSTSFLTKICCNCKKSKCLKLYCECFALGKMCDQGSCNCNLCWNNKEHQDEREKAIQGIINREPLAFENKIEKKLELDVGRHKKGCHCSKSNCQKKYCECFLNGVLCSQLCKCSDCENNSHHQHSSPMNLHPQNQIQLENLKKSQNSENQIIQNLSNTNENSSQSESCEKFHKKRVSTSESESSIKTRLRTKAHT